MAVQSDAITARILQDAEVKAQEITNSYELKSKAALLEAQDYANQKKKECKLLAKEKQIEIKDKYSTLARIEGNKIVLQSKQKVLKGVKDGALNFLCALNKAETLKLAESLIENNAEKDDEILFNLNDVKVEDIESFKAVKSLKLAVKQDKDLDYGIMLCGKNVDKNLLFKTLVENTYSENESEICFKLFN